MDFGFGSCLNFKKKVFDWREKIIGLSVISVVYEVVFMSYEFCIKDLEDG